MKGILSLIFTFLFNCSINLSTVTGQAVATGHVTAEVVYEVSAVSNTITTFSLKGNDVNADLSQSDQTSLNQGNIKLGAITINSGKGVVCDVIVHPAKLSDSKGNAFIIEPSIDKFSPTDIPLTKSEHTLQISGKARLMNKQASGQYQGTYTIVLAFN